MLIESIVKCNISSNIINKETKNLFMYPPIQKHI